MNKHKIIKKKGGYIVKNKKYKVKKILSIVLLCSMLLTGCKKEPEGPSKEEIQYEKNIKNAPKLSEEVASTIERSYGTALTKEQEEEIKATTPTGVEPHLAPENTLNPGKEVAIALGSMTREELLNLDREAQLTIFVNGIIRDEYSIAAHTLYGPEKIKEYKAAFKKSLMREIETDTYEKTTEIEVDTLLKNLGLSKNKVFSRNIDIIIASLNAVYVLPKIESDFKDMVTVKGHAKGLQLGESLRSMKEEAINFVSFSEGESYEQTDEQIKALNVVYDAAIEEVIKNTKLSTYEKSAPLGGFIKEGDVWIPAEWDKFSSGYVKFAFEIL